MLAFHRIFLQQKSFISFKMCWVLFRHSLTSSKKNTVSVLWQIYAINFINGHLTMQAWSPKEFVSGKADNEWIDIWLLYALLTKSSQIWKYQFNVELIGFFRWLTNLYPNWILSNWRLKIHRIQHVYNLCWICISFVSKS